MENFFKGLFDTEMTTVISVTDFLFCLAAAILGGIIIAFSYMYKTRFTKSFVITLALLPAVVCVVIMMVNGNLGAGVAVAGAFSLVRFRSVPGTAKEICMIFLAMSTGLIVGMGYVGFSLLFTIITCAAYVFYSLLSIKSNKNTCLYKSIKITIPEDLDYSDVFDDVLKEYTKKYELCEVKTTNMGSLFRLTYDVILKDNINEKELIDKIRCKNGNLEIFITRQATVNTEL